MTIKERTETYQWFYGYNEQELELLKRGYETGATEQEAIDKKKLMELKERIIDWFAEVSAATIVPHYSLQDANEYREELEQLFDEEGEQ